METVIGILVDVSGSMEISFKGSGKQRGGEWARANFKLIDDMIKHDVSSRNHVFALGFGGRYDPAAFDLLNTIETARTPSVSKHLTLKETLDRILTILETNGAPRVRIWGKMNVLLSVVKETDAKLFLDRLKVDQNFINQFVNDCLPEECREAKLSTNEAGFTAMRYAPLASVLLLPVGGFIVGPILAGATAVVSKVASEKGQEVATEGSVREAVEKAKQLLYELTCVKIGNGAAMDVHKARDILHGDTGIKEEDLTDDRVDELMDKIRSFIYSGTPMMETLNHAKRLFAIPRFNGYKKLLFILSDGEPSDGQFPPIAELEALGVTTVSCYITSDEIQDPKRLYSRCQASWDCAAGLMFRMSSTITTQNIPRTIFVKRGWTIDIEDNETRLFAQVNHPGVLDDVCDLAREVVCSQDALSDLLTSIDLDLYINKVKQSISPQGQIGNASYANAIASVFHISMERIIEREEGVPDLLKIRKEIMEANRIHEENTLQVLQEVCPKYRLQCKEICVKEAFEAITEKRPILAIFKLTDAEKDNLSKFFQGNPRGILQSSDLACRWPTGKRRLHGAVLTSFDSQGLRLMNSEGDNWGDGGFFRIRCANVLGLEFFDVDRAYLTESEKNVSSRRGAEVASQLIARLKGLQAAEYVCPKCHRSSSLGDYTGHALETKCPKCRSKFRIEKSGEDLALNLYLLSLSTPVKRTA